MNELIDNIKNGNLVIVPTDTVYGISCDATNIEAVKKVFLAKQRSQKPLIVLVSSIEMLKKYTKNLNDLELELVNKYWPNTLTILFEKNELIADEVTCSSPYVGIRMPNNKLLLDVMNKLDKPLISTSANISGNEVITNTNLIEEELLKHINYVYDDGEKTNVSSTLVKVEDNKIKILREGLLSEQIKSDFKDKLYE